jgi:hypothetical protein
VAQSHLARTRHRPQRAFAGAAFLFGPTVVGVATPTKQARILPTEREKCILPHRSDDLPAGGYTYVTVGRLHGPNRTAWVTARPAARSGYVPWSSTLLIDVLGVEAPKPLVRAATPSRSLSANARSSSAPAFVLHVLGSPSQTRRALSSAAVSAYSPSLLTAQRLFLLLP